MPDTENTPPPTSPGNTRFAARSAGIVGIAVMCSRVLGLAREVLFNALFEAKTLQFFLAAFRIPNLLRDLFAEGALSTAFITTFSKKIATEGDESAWRLANRIGTLTLTVMSGITLLGMFFSPQLISFIAGGFKGDDALLTAHLTTIMFPFILMVSLAAQVMGMLNAKSVFGWPAMASAFFNIGSILGGIAIAWKIDPTFGRTALTGLAYGTLTGGFLQLLVQIPSLRRVGYHPRLDFHWRDEGVATVLRLMAPAVIAASAVQVNVMVNTSFATHCEPGSVTWLNNAFRLMQLPLGVFGVAIGTVTLPLLSRNAALGRNDDFRTALARGIRLVFLLTVPASIGLWMLAEPIISVIYQRGKVTPHDVTQAAAALKFYAIGLAAYSGMKVIAPAFYAIDRRKTPMVVSFIAVGTNLLLNWFFTFKMDLGHKGLALSTGLVATINFLVLYALMRRHVGGLETRTMFMALGKIAVAGTLLILICWAAQTWVLAGWSRMNFGMRLLSLLGTIFAGCGAFFTAAFLLKLDEMHDVVAVFQRRLSRKKTAGQ